MPVSRVRLAAQKQAKIRSILTLIANHIWRFGFQPSLREIAETMGWDSPGYVQTLLTHHFRKSSGGRVNMQGRAISFDWQEYVTDTSVPWHAPTKSVRYPSLGTVAKGTTSRKLG